MWKMDSSSKLNLCSLLNPDLRKINGKNLNSFHWGMGNGGCGQSIGSFSQLLLPPHTFPLLYHGSFPQDTVLYKLLLCGSSMAHSCFREYPPALACGPAWAAVWISAHHGPPWAAGEHLLWHLEHHLPSSCSHLSIHRVIYLVFFPSSSQRLPLQSHCCQLLGTGTQYNCSVSILIKY